MINNNINSQNFQGRKPIIKSADLICRQVNTKFPHISPRFCWFNLNEPVKYDASFVRLEQKLSRLRFFTQNSEYAFDYYKNLLSLLKKNQCANCGELADVAYLICKNRHLKDVNKTAVYGYNRKTKKLIDYDHFVVSFKHNNKYVIIDPLLGVADFASNCKFIYKNMFGKFFENFDKKLDIVFKKEGTVKIHPDNLKELSRKFPQIK